LSLSSDFLVSRFAFSNSQLVPLRHVITQRENRGSSKRIIDTGFACAATFVTLGYGVAAVTARFTATGTAMCEPLPLR
jgi:hypothetical protein